jgi:arginyl-tRNA synthetase
MKDVIAKFIKQVLDDKNVILSEKEISSVISVPPSHDMGDFAFPCFILAPKFKEEPATIALDLRTEMANLPEGITEIQTNGPYINFFIDRKSLSLELIDRILKEKEDYGKIYPEKQPKTMIEFPSPNTNKPLHLGHLRNMAIGESVSRILEYCGEKVIRANLNNDRGIHICKSMAAYLKYGKNKTPKSEKKKSDHFVGDYYVMFNKRAEKNEKLEIFSHRLLQLWESGDKETIEVWKKMNAWALEGFKETYNKLGIKHDVEFFESEIYKNGKDIVLQALKDGIFKKRKDGAVVADLKKEGLDEKVLLRIDGTSVYITQDLYLAKLKFEKYKPDKSIYVVGNEQNHHFKVLMALLKKIGFEKGINHLSYGMVNLPEGRMKSREGTVVDADDLIDKVQALVKKALSSRAKLQKKELDKRSLIIALSAIKYMLLKVDIKKDMVFNPKESINFEGDTGPYLLYGYARASSILKKIKKAPKKNYFDNLEKAEVSLIKKLSEYPEIVKKAYSSLNPSLISNYSYQLVQIFNEFYHSCPVKDSEKEFFRLKLVESFRQILKNALYLLDIETLEEM